MVKELEWIPTENQYFFISTRAPGWRSSCADVTIPGWSRVCGHIKLHAMCVNKIVWRRSNNWCQWREIFQTIARGCGYLSASLLIFLSLLTLSFSFSHSILLSLYPPHHPRAGRGRRGWRQQRTKENALVNDDIISSMSWCLYIAARLWASPFVHPTKPPTEVSLAGDWKPVLNLFSRSWTLILATNLTVRHQSSASPSKFDPNFKFEPQNVVRRRHTCKIFIYTFACVRAKKSFFFFW